MSRKNMEKSWRVGFLDKRRPRYRGGPEIRPVAGAGATPQLHYEGLKPDETGKHMA